MAIHRRLIIWTFGALTLFVTAALGAPPPLIAWAREALTEVLPLPAMHLELPLVAASAVMTAALAFAMASLAGRATRFRRFGQTWWHRDHRHRYALS